MKKNSQGLLLISILLLTSGCDIGPGPFTCGGAHCPDDPPKPTYQNILIDVQVTDFNTGNALSGASVTIHSRNSGSTWTGITNTLGQYSILLEGNQCYTVEVKYALFDSRSYSACADKHDRDKAYSKVVLQLRPVDD